MTKKKKSPVQKAAESDKEGNESDIDEQPRRDSDNDEALYEASIKTPVKKSVMILRERRELLEKNEAFAKRKRDNAGAIDDNTTVPSLYNHLGKVAFLNYKKF